MIEQGDSPIDLGHYVQGLDNSVLREVAANACGGSVANVRVDVEPLASSTYGCFTGDKVILTLSYETTDGGSGETEVYVKRQLTYPGYKETEHYQYLNNSGMPVPQFYSSHLDEQQLEVLFLENATPNLDGNRILKSRENYHAFLSIVARANALRPEGPYRESLFHFGPEGSIDRGKRTISAVWQSAVNDRLNDALKQLCTDESKKVLLALAESLSEVVPAMTLGYTIDDFIPVKIGWRQGTGEMLVCDFLTTGLGPRFADPAFWIGCPDYAQKAGYKREELAGHYFSEYLAAGGEEMPFETLLSETHVLWQMYVLGGLNWWHDNALTGIESSKDEDKGRRMCQERLEHDLANLLRSLH